MSISTILQLILFGSGISFDQLHVAVISGTELAVSIMSYDGSIHGK